MLEVLIVSALARVELPAAFWRKHRIGELDAEDAAILTQAFESDLFGSDTEPSRFAVVGVTQPILDRAAELTATHGLRAYDAVQLSTAIAVRSADPECRSLACSDGELRAAAASSGFDLVP